MSQTVDHLGPIVAKVVVKKQKWSTFLRDDVAELYGIILKLYYRGFSIIMSRIHCAAALIS